MIASAPDKVDMIGKILAEYRIVEELGGQPGSPVCKAVGLDGRKPVAIKLFPSERSHDKAQLQTLLDSLRSISRLGQPGIPRLIGSGLTGGRAFIIMPFMSGGSLQERFEIGQVSHEDALALLDVIAGSLEQIHKRNMVHGHLSPSEVMFDDAGRPQIIGLGHSLFVRTHEDRIAQAEENVYAAPEVRAGAPPTPASDQYSLAVLAFEMLARQPAHVAIETAALERSNGGVSSNPQVQLGPKVVEVLQRALEDDPSRRYGSISEMVRALHSADRMRDSAGHAPHPRRADDRRSHRGSRSLGWGVASLAVVTLGCFAMTMPAIAAARWMRLDLATITDLFSSRRAPPAVAVRPVRSWISLPELPLSISLPASFENPDLPLPTETQVRGYVAEPTVTTSEADHGSGDVAPTDSRPAAGETMGQDTQDLPVSGSASNEDPAGPTATRQTGPTSSSSDPPQYSSTPVPSPTATDWVMCSDSAGQSQGCSSTPPAPDR